MESTASISASTWLSTGSIISVAYENIGWSTSEVWTAQLQNCIISISRCLRKHLSEFDFGIRNDSLIEDHLHIFVSSYYSVILKYIQFISAYLPFQGHLDLVLVWLADSKCRGLFSEIHTGDGRWDIQEQLPAGDTVVPIICASDMPYLTTFSSSQPTWPLDLTIGNIWKDICSTPHHCIWIVFGLIFSPQ